MQTPICDFVRAYADAQVHRLHMPGHKGNGVLGIEALDITEIHGADSLYQAQGIIAQSQDNASALFGCRTLYSTEGASQCIRAMLYLVSLYARRQGSEPLVVAARNAHKAFLTAVAMLDVQVQWLYPAQQEGYLSCDITAEQWEQYLQASAQKPTALYLTSPDYPGHISDIRALAEVCRRHGVLLVVDNAHGAYLKFLPQSLHPIDLGAHLCCDSAHKTLPVLTGGAYLHLCDEMDAVVGQQAQDAMMMFGSTSPSYPVLQSLDAANRYLQGYPERLREMLGQVQGLKDRLCRHGYVLYGNEPLKLTLRTKPYGYTGEQMAQLLREQRIEPEFADPDFLVLMLSAETQTQTLQYLEQVLCGIAARPPITQLCPAPTVGQRVMSVRQAMLACSQTLPVQQCIGRVLAAPTVGCPPAVPILVCGERIDRHAADCFAYYGIEQCCVVAEQG